MHRSFALLATWVTLALPLPAQIGKQPIIRAGSPEDKALLEIDAATDIAKKFELLEKFLAEFGEGGQGDMALLAYERYVAHYLSEKNYDKAFEYGEKALALDPDNFGVAYTMIRVAYEKGDIAKAFDYGDRTGAILQRYKALPPPEGTTEATWQERKAITLDNLKDQLNYAYYTLFTTAYQLQNPVSKAALLERYVNAFPDSPYSVDAQMLVADAYQQAQNPAKVVEFAQNVLRRQPENFWMLVVLADHWTTQREQLEKAEESAQKALQLLGKADKPAQFAEDDWQKRKALQQGLAWSALGQVHVHKNRDAQAVEALKAATPLLKAYPFYYGRTLYFLGFALARMKRVAEARPVLTEAASVESPYRALAQDTLGKIGGPVPAKGPAKRRP